MAKFKVGDIVEFYRTDNPEHYCFIGNDCEILGFHGRGYETSLDNGMLCCDDYCVRKKKPPEEAASWEEVQKKTGWNPIKEKVK